MTQYPIPKVLKTDRLTLLPLQDLKAEDVLEFHLTNKEFLKPFIPTPPKEFYTEAFWQKKIWMSQQDWQDGKALRFAIKRDESANAILGLVNFTQVFRGPLQSCMLGYNLDQKQTGRGYMTEAMKELISYLFTTWDLHRIQANTLIENQASQKVLQKLGFTLEGEGKNYLYINDRWQDHKFYALINEGWKGRFI